MTQKSFSNTLTLIILCLFLLDLVLGGFPYYFGEREDLVVSGALKAVLLTLGYIMVFFHGFTDRKSIFLLRSHCPILFLLIIWGVLSTISFLVGSYIESSRFTYILGDYYKFLLLPGTFFLLYFGFRTTKAISVLLEWMIVAYSVLGLWYIGLYLANELRMYQITPAALYVPFMLPVLLYYAARNRDGVVRYFAMAALIEIPLLIYFSQSSSLVLITLFIIILFIFIYYRTYSIYLSGSVGILLLIGILVHFNSDGTRNFEKYILKEHPIEKHIVIKVQNLFKYDIPLYEKFELVGGGRFSEPSGILSFFINNPFQLWTGSGMGRYFEKPSTKYFHVYSPVHFIELTYGEILYRLGLPGFLILIALIGLYFQRCLKLAGVDRFAEPGRLIFLFGVVYFISYIYVSPITRPFLLFALFYVWILTIDKEINSQSNLQQVRSPF